MQIQEPSTSTVEFFGLRAAVDTGNQTLYSPISAIDLVLAPISDPVARLTRECSALRLKLATAVRKERRVLHKQLLPPIQTPPSTSSSPLSQLGLHFNPFDSPPPSHTTPTFTYTENSSPHPLHSTNPQPTTTRCTPNNRKTFRRNKRRKGQTNSQTQSVATNIANNSQPATNQRKEQAGMRPAERARQLEKQLRDVQELLRVRDREIELLKKERDRLVAEREQERIVDKSREGERERERSLEKEREKERQYERAVEVEREKERTREREIENEREIVREKEREYERQQQVIREREREQERQREQELKERERELQRDREQLEADRNRAPSPIRSTPELHMRPLSTLSPIPIYRDQLDRTPSLRRTKSQIPLQLSREDNLSCPASPLANPSPHFPQLHVPTLGIDAEQVAQLRSLDVFMTKTDGWSGAQVIQAVEDLNSEITHFAASAVESCIFERRLPNLQTLNFNPPAGRGRRGRRRGRDSANNSGRSTPKSPLGPSQELVDSVNWLGNSFAKVLGTKDHAQDPMLVQLALQASVATCCARALSLFCIGFPSKLDALLSRVFGHLHSTEPQPTSSRWRSLTHKSIQILYPGLEEFAVSELVTTMLKWSSTIFTLCGISPIPNGINNTVHPPTPPTKDIVPHLNSPTLKGQLRRIAEATFTLAKVIREDILSTVFEVILVESGTPYDETGMTNTFKDVHFGPCAAPNGNGAVNGVATMGPPALGNAGSQNNAVSAKSGNNSISAASDKNKVLCTTELGLRCVTKKGKSRINGETSEALDMEGKPVQSVDMFETRVLLQPKVVLDSAMDALN